MKRLVILMTACVALTFGCNHHEKKTVLQGVYKLKVYQTEQNQFGYDIYKDGAVMIHQPTIPSISGNYGFQTKDDAEKVAELMVDKLNKNIMPPSVTQAELDSLKIPIN